MITLHAEQSCQDRNGNKSQKSTMGPQKYLSPQDQAAFLILHSDQRFRLRKSRSDHPKWWAPADEFLDKGTRTTSGRETAWVDLQPSRRDLLSERKEENIRDFKQFRNSISFNFSLLCNTSWYGKAAAGRLPGVIPVPEEAISLAQISRAFLSEWWTDIQSATSLGPSSIWRKCDE